jgi:hypothetical protein
MIRATMARVADDELRHAELAWDIDDWAQTMLTQEARCRVRAAQRAALAELERDFGNRFNDEIVRVAGLPDGPRAVAMFDGFAAVVRERTS